METDNMATVPRKQLKDTTLQAKRTVGARVTLPALSGVKITADGGALTFETTNLERCFTDRIEVNSSETWTILVPCVTLDKIVSKLKGDTVTLEPDDDGQRLRLTDGRADVAVRSMVLEDFPALPQPGDGVSATIPADLLGAALTAASTDDGRPALTGVMLDGHGGEIVATDSYRMVRARLPEMFEASALVPGDTVKRILQAKPGDKLDVLVEDGQVTFSTPDGGRYWVTCTVGGKFPNYAGVWPGTFDEVARVDAPRLAEAADRIAAIVSDNRPVVLEAADGHLTIEADGSVVGEVSERVEAVGTSPRIAFNAALLKSLAGLFEADVELHTREGLKPAVLSDGGPVSALLMPMRVH